MVQTIVCDCNERIGTTIDSIKMENYIKKWSSENLEKGIFKELEVSTPYYVGKGVTQTIKWYADKWYSCCSCGTFWEIIYPDFPANGEVRKFISGEKYVDILEKPL